MRVAIVYVDPRESTILHLRYLPNYCFTILSKLLYHFYSMSLRYATIPDYWKTHKIIPTRTHTRMHAHTHTHTHAHTHTFKSENWNSVKCYCPIYLQSNISNLLEYLFYITTKKEGLYDNLKVQI